MFRLIQQFRDNYKYEVVGKNLLLHKTDNSVIINSEQLSEKFIQQCSFVIFDKYLLIDDRNDNYWIYSNQEVVEKKQVMRYFLPISDKFVGFQLREKGQIYGVVLNEKLQVIFTKQLGRFNTYRVLINDDFILFQLWGKEKLQLYTLSTQELQWEYELSDFGTFINHWRDEEQYEIKRIIGFWQNQLLVACSNSLIIVLDAHTGELLHTWQEKKGTFSKINIGFADKIPHAEHFVLDPNANKLIACSIFSYFEIDLITKEITVIELEEELRQYKIADVSGGHGETPLTDTHLIARVSLESRPNDDRMYDGLIALNRNTHKVDWFYPFEEVAISVQKPKLVGNKLYQMDMGGTLHIFER